MEKGNVKVLIMLVRAFIKQAERYGHDYHEFAGCPHGAMEFSDYVEVAHYARLTIYC